MRPIGEHGWGFQFPRVTPDVMDTFYESMHLWDRGHLSKAERGYRQLLREYPEFIDLHHHLAILLDETDRQQEAFKLWQQAVDLGLGCFPQDFSMGQDILPWSYMTNRPFLRAYKGFGLALLKREEIENALAIFMNMLALNPNDNQGVRILAIECAFRLSRPWEVLGISERFPNDIEPDVLYGQVLALYQLGLKAESETALLEAMETHPLVAKELSKKRHTRPRELDPSRVTVGGPDEAYYYWLDAGQQWKNTLGAIDFVRGCLQKHQQ